MPTKEPWSWQENRSGLSIAFFGEGAAAAASDLPAALSPSPPEVSWLRQIHSERVVAARPGLSGDGDALLSDAAGLALAVATADCVPVLLADGRRIAAVHAGWRGLVAGVLPAALAMFESPRQVEAWIGPAIGPCCYEVGDDVAARLVEAADGTVLAKGPAERPHVDLVAVARHQLRQIRQIDQVKLCTRCETSTLASYRRDGEAAGRNWSVIWRSLPQSP